MSASHTTQPAIRPFQIIAPYLAVGTPQHISEHTPGHNWQAIAARPLLILVGVTGVGKSTLLTEMAQHGETYLLLPDRRDLTDQLIISAMQVAGGAPIAPITDRGQRFAYTRRYRELHEGGMAHALAQLWVNTDAPARLVFDGLRGENEVAYAASVLPHARFVMLDAPDLVRLQRLLGRGDAFDRIALTTPTQGDAATFAELGTPEASQIFDAEAEAIILSWLHSGLVTAEQLRAKLQIVIEERRSYDPVATLAALRAHAPESTLYLDTVIHAPAAVASQVIAWLNN